MVGRKAESANPAVLRAERVTTLCSERDLVVRRGQQLRRAPLSSHSPAKPGKVPSGTTLPAREAHRLPSGSPPLQQPMRVCFRIRHPFTSRISPVRHQRRSEQERRCSFQVTLRQCRRHQPDSHSKPIWDRVGSQEVHRRQVVPEQEPRHTDRMEIQDRHQGASNQQQPVESGGSYPLGVVEDRTTRSRRIRTDQRTGHPSHQEQECSAKGAGILVSGT